ncbi:MAG TPA: type II toxin-antitoxin system VapC family toxin [Bryobacteraceae bacterium]|nr:type II toxin-antitoxin system VapC family toxin [Bryobacteraceae bacterium]
MKARVYIETTIPSYLVARPSRDLLIAAHQQLTHHWWASRGPTFDLYVSGAVLEEAASGDVILAKKRLELLSDIPVLALTEAALELAESLVAEGAMPRKAAGDALHIAIATSYACEYLLTWNCRHIANAEIQRMARLVVRSHGFELPTICTPEELMGEEE